MQAHPTGSRPAAPAAHELRLHGHHAKHHRNQHLAQVARKRPGRAGRNRVAVKGDAAHSADRRKYMLLVTGFLSELLELHLQLADEVERELADDAP
jgi:hypothetical protein